MRPTPPFLRVLLISLLVLANAGLANKVSAGNNVWTSNGPIGVSLSISALAIDPVTPTTLYAGTDRSGIFKSTDGGERWFAVNTGLTAMDVRALAIDPMEPTTIYAGISENGVFKTTNGGEHWIAFSAGLSDTSVAALAIDPTTPTKLYAGTRGGHVYVMRQVSRTYLPLMFKSSARPELYVLRGPDLRLPRAWHTATRLTDGRILVVGGSSANDQFLAEVELFDAATGQTSLVAPLHTARHGHTATLLQDGRVLVVGGYNMPTQWLDDAEVYDAIANTWTVVPPHYSHGVAHSATLMKDGRVLVVGGAIGASIHTERVEIFDPLYNTWAEVTPLESDRDAHTAQLLDNGRVLVAGGQAAMGVPNRGDALVYDPQANTWTATGPMVTPRIFSQSVPLPGGRVLVVGGQPLQPGAAIASAEIYAPASNAWTATADLAQARYSHVLVPLPGGQVLAVGGARDWDCCWTNTSFVREIERYDPVTAQWRVVGELPQPRAEATATLLPDGRVWLAGGRTDTTFFSDTWLIGRRTPLLVRYDFEGDFLASGVVADRSGNGHDAQVNGAVATATGISGGQAISFAGNGYVQAASNPAAGRRNVTFSLWFKTAHPEENYKLASGAWWNGGPGSGWIMATHVPEFWSDDGQGLVLPGQPNNENQFAAGEWVHEVVTYDGSRIKEYTNGRLVNDWATTGAAIGQGRPMAVGAWPQFSGYNFQGSIDEFQIFGRSLTQQEVRALYERGRQETL